MLPENVHSSALHPKSPHGALPPPPRALAWSYPKNAGFKTGETMSFNTEMVYRTWMIWGNYIHFMNFDETPK
jgi:hypothetical protein